MEVVGIIGAMEEEVLFLKEKMILKEVRSIASLEYYMGTLHNRAIVIVKGGIGKVNSAICAQVLIDCFHVDAIINTGVAGAVDSQLEIGDVVISKDLLQHDVDASGFGYQLGEIPRMATSIFPADEHMLNIASKGSDALTAGTNVFVERIVSGDQFISSTEKKAWLLNQFKAFCTEMEGAAIAQVCYLNKIPFVAIRAISDKADDSAEVNFEKFTALAAANSCRMIERMLEVM
jgi:adenosylhomocysteine nucleosidase